MSGPAEPAKLSRGAALAVALVFVLVLAVWAPSVLGGFCSDDEDLIVRNDRIGQPGIALRMFTEELWQLQRGGWRPDYYRPLANISLIADHALHGERPAGYHATNAVLHAAVAALLALWLLGLGWDALAAGSAALLFGVHPALDSAVAWISGRTEPLAALFVMAYLVLDLRADRRRSLAARVASVIALACGLLSKETAVVAPVIAALTAVARGGRAIDALRARWTSGLAIASWFAVRAAVLGAAISHGQVAMPGIDVAARLTALPHLVGVLALPWLGRIDYSLGLTASDLAPAAIAGLLVMGAVAWAYREREGASTLPYILAGVIAFAPVAAAVLVKATIGTRLLYLPAAFLVAAFAGWFVRIHPRAVYALGALALLFAATSVARIPRWGSSVALWEAAVREPNASPIARVSLADARHAEGALAESFDLLTDVLPDDPTDAGARLRGLLLVEIGCNDLAADDLRLALARNPGDERTANNLASTLGELGRAHEGVAVLGTYMARFGRPAFMDGNLARLERQPDGAPPSGLVCGTLDVARARLRDAVFLNKRAVLRIRGGQVEQATVLVKAALRTDHTLVPARLTMARVLAVTGETAAARTLLHDVLREDPAHAGAKRMLEQIARHEAAGD